MDDRQKLAAAALAEGKSVEEVSKEVGRSVRTILRWMGGPDFQAAVLRGFRALAILALARYLKHGEDPKAGQAALATLRWLGAGKPRSARKAESVAEDDPDDPDLGEFSEESLRRLKGGD